MKTIQFKCERCNRIFQLKHHLQQHLKKKNKCNRPINTIQHISNTQQHNIVQIINAIKNDLTEEKQDQMIHKCKYCEKEFTRNASVLRHFKTCKIKHARDEEYKELAKMVGILRTEIEKLKSKPSNVTINNTDNSNTINNVQLNNYGKENTDYLENAEYLNKIKMKPHLLGLLDYQNRKYCDPDHSENWNIAITNLKHDICKIYKDNRWQTRKATDIISRGFMRSILDVQEKMENIAYDTGRRPNAKGDILDPKEQDLIDSYDKATCSDVMEDFYVRKLKEIVDMHRQFIYDHTMLHKAEFMRKWKLQQDSQS